MFRIPKLYDSVIVKETGNRAVIIEIDDNNGEKPASYLIEIIDAEKPDDADFTDVVFWCESDQIILVERW